MASLARDAADHRDSKRSVQLVVGDGLAAIAGEGSGGCFGDGLCSQAVIERGSDRRIVIQAAHEVVESSGVRGLNAFEPSGVHAVIDDVAGVIAGDGAGALPTGLDHSRRAEHLHPFVVAVADAPGVVDLDERSAGKSERDDGGVDVSEIGETGFGERGARRVHVEGSRPEIHRAKSKKWTVWSLICPPETAMLSSEGMAGPRLVS